MQSLLGRMTNHSPSSAKIMLVTSRLENAPGGGRELLCKLNHDLLKDIYGNRLVLLELIKSPPSGLKSILAAFRGSIDGLKRESIAAALETIREENVRKLFVDGSNFGELVRAVKKACPEVLICTFFHNIEARFFLGALRQNKTPRALAVLIVNYLAERKSARYSDKIICLSERDSLLLEKLYMRRATHVSPMALRDKLPAASSASSACTGGQTGTFALFVGGAFYANIAGIAWFVENVAPRIRTRISIVGRGFERFKADLELEGRVEVIGEVESLADLYAQSHFVIAPIFDGSGMKTKVAEALMFGKKIIGTPEAFSGYEDISDQAGSVCATADEFVSAIERLTEANVKSFDPELRAVYDARYSYPAARIRLAEILGSME